MVVSPIFIIPGSQADHWNNSPLEFFDCKSLLQIVFCFFFEKVINLMVFGLPWLRYVKMMVLNISLIFQFSSYFEPLAPSCQIYQVTNCRDPCFGLRVILCFEVTGLVSVHFANEMVPRLRAEIWRKPLLTKKKNRVDVPLSHHRI